MTAEAFAADTTPQSEAITILGLSAEHESRHGRAQSIDSTRLTKVWGGDTPVEGAAAVLLLSAVACALAALILLPKWTADDAYIVFRYSENLANHGELNWNVGEDPVEGYTGVALPVILAAVSRLGLSPVLGSKIIGVLSFAFGGVALYLVFCRLAVGGVVRSSCLFLYATAPLLFTHAFSGLETLLFTSMVITSFLALLRCTGSSTHDGLRDTVLLACLLLTSLVRPEGVVLAIASVAALWIARLRDGNVRPWAFLLRTVLVYLAPYVIYFCWRWQYYGQLLPNTFYAKSYPGVFNLGTARSLFDFFRRYVLVPLLAGLVLNLAAPRLAWKRIREGLTPRTESWPLIACLAIIAFALIVLLQYHRSTLEMNYSHRFFVPFFPLALVGIGLLGESGTHVLAECRDQKPMRYRGLVALAMALAVMQVAIYAKELSAELALTTDYKQLLEDEHIPAAQFLRQTVPSSEWLIVHIDAGAIPYFSGLKTVDFGRLNDEVLSRGSLAESEEADYFYSFSAGAVVFTSYDWDALRRPQAAHIYNDPRFERYVLARKYRTREGGLYEYYYEFVFLRKDLVGMSSSQARYSCGGHCKPDPWIARVGARK